MGAKRFLCIKEKFKKLFAARHLYSVLSKVLRPLSRQPMSQSFLAKIKHRSHFREYHSIALANLIPFLKGQLSLHVSQSHA